MTRVQKTAAYKSGYNAGVQIACALNGLTPGDSMRKSAFADNALSSVEMQTALCKIASGLFKEAGMTGTPEQVLYSRLSHNTHPLTRYSTERFIVPVVKALAKEAKVAYEDIMEKSASQLLATGLLAKLFGRSIGTGPEAMRLLALLGVGAGATTGALSWALTRDATADEAETEAKLKQADHYRRVAKDLQKRLNIEDQVNKDTKALKNALEDQGEGAYVI